MDVLGILNGPIYYSNKGCLIYFHTSRIVCGPACFFVLFDDVQQDYCFFRGPWDH